MFDSAQDAKQKLESTVVLLDEVPIYVTNALDGDGPGKIRLRYASLPCEGRDFDDKQVEFSEERIDFRTLGSRLGYMNAISRSGHKQAIYTMRTPTRKTIQGLSRANLQFSHFESTDQMPGNNCPWEDHFSKKHFSDMLKGEYPSMGSAYDRIEKGWTAVAFNRHFALKHKTVGPIYLEYKGRDVAWTENLDRFNLSPAFKHLGETLEFYGIAYKLAK